MCIHLLEYKMWYEKVYGVFEKCPFQRRPQGSEQTGLPIILPRIFELDVPVAVTNRIHIYTRIFLCVFYYTGIYKLLYDTRARSITEKCIYIYFSSLSVIGSLRFSGNTSYRSFGSRSWSLPSTNIGTNQLENRETTLSRTVSSIYLAQLSLADFQKKGIDTHITHQIPINSVYKTHQKNSLLNGLAVSLGLGLWYFFSLSISPMYKTDVSSSITRIVI